MELNNIKDYLKKYNCIAICTIVQTKGSTPLKSGAKMIVLPNKSIIGTLGGGAFEKKVIEDAVKCIQKQECQLFTHHLTKDHQMCCGGTVWVFVDIITDSNKLLIFGAGHVGTSLAKIALIDKFDVFLIDNRNDILQQASTNINNEQLHLIYSEKLEHFVEEYDGNYTNIFCIICTYDHQLDRSILLKAVNKPFKYIGMIGSKRKVFFTKKYLIENNVSEEFIEKIDMPIGLNINAQNPFEIAISILAKIIEVKNSHKSNNHPKLSEQELNENLNLCYQKMS
ncbi:MAG TPA: XdhC family protein [Bacteroidia bacterium]|mgnify:CR=1 FL=1|nr:XdhC family protein [Bacteroidia bacterium]